MILWKFLSTETHDKDFKSTKIDFYQNRLTNRVRAKFEQVILPGLSVENDSFQFKGSVEAASVEDVRGVLLILRVF